MRGAPTLIVSETGIQPIGLFGSPWRRVESVFLQPRRFPEYLRLQNVRDRGFDLPKLTGAAGGRACVPGAQGSAEPGRDPTLARIGDVPPVEPQAVCARGGDAAPDPPATTRAIDGLGRMIDLMA